MMKSITRTLVAMSTGMVLGTSSAQTTDLTPSVESVPLKKVGIFTVNYTPYAIDAVIIAPPTGPQVELGGSIPGKDQGGAGAPKCCYQLPRPGERVMVYWTGPALGQGRHIDRAVVLTGKAPTDPDRFANLIVRFMDDFPAATIQAEYISDDDLRAGHDSPHIDQLLWPVLNRLTGQ